MILRHVVVFGKEVDCLFGDLKVEVGIPGEDLPSEVFSIFSIYLGRQLRTFWFHHQPRRVPCMIHVSAPILAMV
jgi:hypothetical protein